MKKIILIGAGGQSKVIIDLIRKRVSYLKEEIEIVGILDDSFDSKEKTISGVKVIGTTSLISQYRDNAEFIISIGSNKVRKIISEKYPDIKYYTAIHHTAIIAEGVVVGKGSMILAGTIINSDVRIGNHTIINSGSIIEHDNVIEDFVHVSPGVTLAGNVKVKTLSWIGAGSVVIQGITVEENAVVGAGSVVIRDILKNSVNVGNPTRIIKEKE